MRTCGDPCLSTLSPPSLAAAVWPLIEALPAVLSGQSRQPQSCSEFAAVVRAKSSRRGFRRDFCRMAAAALALAHPLRRLACAQKTGICRRADGRNCRQATDSDASGKGRTAQYANPNARRLLQKEALALSRRHAQDLRSRFATLVLGRSTAWSPRGGFIIHPAQSRGGARAGREMD